MTRVPRSLVLGLAFAMLTMAGSVRGAEAPRDEPLWLVTEGEAMLASPPTARAVAELPKNGPVIKIQTPPIGAELSPPFALDVLFEPRLGGTAAKMETLKVTYLKVIEVDVTDRFKPYIKDNRLFVEKANVPQGRHRLKITITDLDGRTTAEIFQVTVK